MKRAAIGEEQTPVDSEQYRNTRHRISARGKCVTGAVPRSLVPLKAGPVPSGRSLGRPRRTDGCGNRWGEI